MGLVAGTCPKNSNQFEFVGLVAATKFWSMRLVAGTSRIVCADLKDNFMPFQLNHDKTTICINPRVKQFIDWFVK